MVLPLDLVREDPDMKLAEAERVRRTARRLARMIIARGRPVNGGLAWVMNDGERVYHEIRSDKPAVNMARDDGQTGMVVTLAEFAKHIEDDEILNAARKAADFVIQDAVRTEHDWKFARYVEIDAPRDVSGAERSP